MRYFTDSHKFETIVLTGLSEKVMLTAFVFKIALNAPRIAVNRAEIVKCIRQQVHM